jgi:DNA invertase Pin-like site-specific DNA recombinase
MTLAVFAGMAEHERELISARTKAALAARKACGLSLSADKQAGFDGLAADQVLIRAHRSNLIDEPN